MTPLAELPEWLAEKIGRARKPKSRAAEKPRPLASDAPADIQRAAKYLRTEAEPAVEGAAGDATTYLVAAQIRDMGVSEKTAFDLMAEHYNERCSPPWPLEDLEQKVRNAYAYTVNPQGIASPQAEFQDRTVAEALPAPGLLRPVHPFDPAAIPPRPWVFDRFAMAGRITTLIAPPGAGKTTLMATIAASKASGRNLLGMDPLGRAPVAVWNQEDDIDELRRRLAAAMQHYGLTFPDLMDADGSPMLYLNSGEQRMLKIARKVGLHGGIEPEDADALTEALRAAGVKLFVVDPFSETHPADENNNNEVLEVAKIYRAIAQKAECGVVIVHHTRKPSAADSRGHVGNMDSGRGASSLSGAARLMFTLYGMAKDDAKRYGIDPAQRHRYVRLDDAKGQYGLMSDEPRWFERLSVRLPRIGDPDGDSVGVLAPASLARALEVKEAGSVGAGLASKKDLAMLAVLAGLSAEGGVSRAEWRKACQAAGLFDEDMSREAVRKAHDRIAERLAAGGDVLQPEPGIFIVKKGESDD